MCREGKKGGNIITSYARVFQKVFRHQLMEKKKEASTSLRRRGLLAKGAKQERAKRQSSVKEMEGEGGLLNGPEQFFANRRYARNEGKFFFRSPFDRAKKGGAEVKGDGRMTYYFWDSYEKERASLYKKWKLNGREGKEKGKKTIQREKGLRGDRG